MPRNIHNTVGYFTTSNSTIPKVESSFKINGHGSMAKYQQSTSNNTNIPVTTHFGIVTCYEKQPPSTPAVFKLTSDLITSTSNIVILAKNSISNQTDDNLVHISIYSSTVKDGFVTIIMVNQDQTNSTHGKPSFYYWIL